MCESSMGSVRFGSDRTSSVVDDMDMQFAVPFLSEAVDFNFYRVYHKKKGFRLFFFVYLRFLMFSQFGEFFLCLVGFLFSLVWS